MYERMDGRLARNWRGLASSLEECADVRASEEGDPQLLIPGVFGDVTAEVHSRVQILRGELVLTPFIQQL